MELLADLGTMAALGAVSSLHCAQMCGPIVLAYSASARSSRPADHGGQIEASPNAAQHKFPQRTLGADLSVPRFGTNWLSPALRMHLAYNAGRILTYSLMGALAGFSGSGVTFLGRTTGRAATGALAAGVLMIIAGTLMAGLVKSNNLVRIGGTPLLARLSYWPARLLRSSTVFSRFGLGLSLGILPCGLVYAALLKALSTESATHGALTMAAFGAGTAASLLAIGSFATPLLGWLRARGAGAWPDRVAALSLVVFGGVMIWHSLAAPETFAAGSNHGVHCH